MTELPVSQGNRTQHKTLFFVGATAWSMYNFRLEVLKFFSRDYHVSVLAHDDAWGVKLRREGITYVPIDIDNKSISSFKDLKLTWQLCGLYRKYNPLLVFHYTIKPTIYGSLAAALCKNVKSIAVVTVEGETSLSKTYPDKMDQVHVSIFVPIS